MPAILRLVRFQVQHLIAEVADVQVVYGGLEIQFQGLGLIRLAEYVGEVGIAVLVCHQREHSVRYADALYVERVFLVEEAFEGELGRDVAGEEYGILSACAAVVREQGVRDYDGVERLHPEAPYLHLSVNFLLYGLKGPLGYSGLHCRYLQQEDGCHQKKQQTGQDAENYVLGLFYTKRV